MEVPTVQGVLCRTYGKVWRDNGQGIPGDGDNLAEAVDVDVLVLVDLVKELVERLGGGGHDGEGEGAGGKRSVGTKKEKEEKEKEEGKRSEKKRRKNVNKFPGPKNTSKQGKEGIGRRYVTQVRARFPTHTRTRPSSASAARNCSHD